MPKEIVFNYPIEKPFTEKELQEFKKFKIEVKDVVIDGKVKVLEKFKVFTFTILDYSVADKNKINSFLMNHHLKIKL